MFTSSCFILTNMVKFTACVFLVIVASTALDVKGDEESQRRAYCDKWGVTFDQGEKITVPQQCMQATCLNGVQNEISLSLCPRLKVRAECYLSNENVKQRYPDCCPKPVCPQG